MKLFQYFYDQALTWAKHKNAPTFLGGMSFAESVFFPIPPDVMLAPMSLARPNAAWRYALITSIASVIGGICGYWLGWFAFDTWLQPWIASMGYDGKMQTAMGWFEAYGIWVVFLAGFSPIPYKIFTISAGVLQMAFLPFILASVVGRSARFYLVAGLMRWGGAKMEAKLREYIDIIGWSVVALAVVLYLLLR